MTNATVTVTDSGGNDRLAITHGSCTFGLGTWVIGDYVGGGPATFVNSTVSWNPATSTLSVTLGALSTSSSVRSNVALKANTYTDTGGRTDLAGNAVPTTTFTNGTTTRF